MAIHANSTTAPAVQPGLLPAGFSGAVPVPTPDLTAETVAMLDAIPPDVPHGAVELSPAQEALHVSRRKELYEILHPETVQYAAGGHAKRGSASANLALAADTSSRTSRSERAVRRGARTGRGSIRRQPQFFSGGRIAGRG